MGLLKISLLCLQGMDGTKGSSKNICKNFIRGIKSEFISKNRDGSRSQTLEVTQMLYYIIDSV